MEVNLQEQLENLGLQVNEVKIYLALLELGKGTVSQISKIAHLNRTTGYDILERICLYGIANRSSVGKKRIYIAGCGGMLGEAFHKYFKDVLKSGYRTQALRKI